jgi:hypothetical protein
MTIYAPKEFLVVFLMLGSYMTSFAQNLRDCKPGELCSAMIRDAYLDSKKNVLIDNWTDFAGSNLEAEFSLSDRNALVTSLRLDALGCIYPSTVNDDKFKRSFLNENVPQKRFYKLSFLDVFDHNSSFQELIAAQSPAFIESLTAQNDIRNQHNSLSEKADATFAFRKIWNQHYLPKYASELNAIIKQHNVKEVFFFIHGFNVPYSLAQLQGNAVFNRIIADRKIRAVQEKILFIRVFWPSFSAKRTRFMDNDRNCSVKNKGIAILKTRLYSFVSNRGYLCGNTVNQLMLQLPQELKYNFISHSFGSTISAAMLFSPVSKIKVKDRETPFNKNMIDQFKNQSPLSEWKINFFMNAAGMSGVSTFQGLDEEKNKQHFFFIGHNSEDKMLLKKHLPFMQFPACLSSTTLGCNHHSEVDSLLSLAASRKLLGNFFESRTSTLREHDFFCYLQQIGFQSFFDRFISR